jgi:hypothetical protein
MPSAWLKENSPDMKQIEQWMNIMKFFFQKLSSTMSLMFPSKVLAVIDIKMTR